MRQLISKYKYVLLIVFVWMVIGSALLVAIYLVKDTDVLAMQRISLLVRIYIVASPLAIGLTAYAKRNL